MDTMGTLSGGNRPARKYSKLLDPTTLVLIATILVSLFFLVSYSRLNVSLRRENDQLRENAAKISQAEAGDAVPPFQSTDIEGRPAGISYKTSQKHLLFVFTSHCGACVEELPNWDRLAPQMSAAGLDVRAISLDPLDETRASTGGKVTNLNIVLAPDRNFIRTYRVYGFPQVMLVSDEGVVEWVHVGKLSEEHLNELAAKIPPPGMSNR